MLRRKAAGIVALAWVEEETRIVGNEFVLGEAKLRDDEIGVWIVNGLTGERSPDFVFVVVVVTVAPAGLTSLGKSIGLVGDALVHDDELGGRPGLTWSPEIPPESCALGPPATADVVIPPRFARDDRIALLYGRAVERGLGQLSGRAASWSRCRAGTQQSRENNSCDSNGSTDSRKPAYRVNVNVLIEFHTGYLAESPGRKGREDTSFKKISKIRIFTSGFFLVL